MAPRCELRQVTLDGTGWAGEYPPAALPTAKVIRLTNKRRFHGILTFEKPKFINTDAQAITREMIAAYEAASVKPCSLLKPSGYWLTGPPIGKSCCAVPFNPPLNKTWRPLPVHQCLELFSRAGRRLPSTGLTGAHQGGIFTGVTIAMLAGTRLSASR